MNDVFIIDLTTMVLVCVCVEVCCVFICTWHVCAHLSINLVCSNCGVCTYVCCECSSLSE